MTEKNKGVVTKQTCCYFPPAMHKSIKRKAADTEMTMSDLLITAWEFWLSHGAPIAGVPTNPPPDSPQIT